MNRTRRVAATATATLAAFTLSIGAAYAARTESGSHACSGDTPWGFASAFFSPGDWQIQPPGSTQTFSGYTQTAQTLTAQSQQSGGGAWRIYSSVDFSTVNIGCNAFGK